MSRKFLTALDLAKNELQNAVVQNLAAAPSSPVKGQLYFDTSTNTLYWYNGTAWVAASPGTGFPGYGSVTQEQTFGATKNDGVATTVARSDHTHGNPVHDNAAHSAVSLSALAVPTGPLSMNGQKITNLGTPAALTDATTVQYVQTQVAGLSWKNPVDVATTANVALSGAAQTIDGVTGWTTILVKNQTTAGDNGIYDVQSGAWTRRADADVNTEYPGAAVYVKQGATQGDTAWTCTNDIPPTQWTTPITFVQFAGAGTVGAGTGMTQSGNTLNVIAGDTSLTVAADDVRVNTSVIATVASLAGYTPTSRTVTAGAGLTGGGDLSANRTLDVVAGDTSLTVAADSVVVNTAVIATVASVTAKADKTTTVSAGTGITGGGDLSTNRTFALDTAYTDGRYATVANGAKRYAVDVGGATSQVITHGLNTLDVIIQVYRKASPFDQVECDVEHTSTTTATLRFTTAPAAAEYRAVVLA